MIARSYGVRTRILTWTFAVIVAAAALADGRAAADEAVRAEFKRPDRLHFPAEAPYSPQIATLGKMLFFDPRLSADSSTSCASCHDPAFAWGAPGPSRDALAQAPTRRQTPSIENLAEAELLNRDGSAPNLETQALRSITDAGKMGAQLDQVEARLLELDAYRRWFATLFPTQGVTEETVAVSIATFLRTLRSGWAPFDDWVEGDEDAISPSAKRGFELFVGPAGCVTCHQGWSFTDHRFHDTGLETNDVGRGALDHANPLKRYAFKTPSLRNVALRAPYMHRGHVPSLEDVIHRYEQGGVDRPSRSPRLRRIRLNPLERADLIEFLDTLTAHEAYAVTPILPRR